MAALLRVSAQGCLVGGLFLTVFSPATGGNMIQGANSFLFPQHLLPEPLRDVKVAILIGKCLREQPEAASVEPKVTPRKRGRPRKGEQGAPSAPRGRYGGQGGRSAEEQIRLLQSDMHIRAIPQAPFRRLVQDSVKDLVTEKRKWEATKDYPNLRVSSAAMDVLQDAVEARVFFVPWMSPPWLYLTM